MIWLKGFPPTPIGEGTMEDPGEVELSPDFEGHGEPAVKAVTALPAKRKESMASDGPETPSGVGAVNAESVERGDKAPHGDVPSEEAGTQDAGSPWVPDRVKKALEKYPLIRLTL